jgi:hypothetical protein
LDPDFPWRAHHRLRLLRVGGEADAFERLDYDVEGLLKELGILRCNVSIVNIKNGEECLNSDGELAVRVVERLTHDPHPLADHCVDNNVKQFCR